MQVKIWQPSKPGTCHTGARHLYRHTPVPKGLPALRGTVQQDTASLDCVADVQLGWHSCWQAKNVGPPLCPLAVQMQLDCSLLVAAAEPVASGGLGLQYGLTWRLSAALLLMSKRVGLFILSVAAYLGLPCDNAYRVQTCWGSRSPGTS